MPVVIDGFYYETSKVENYEYKLELRSSLKLIFSTPLGFFTLLRDSRFDEILKQYNARWYNDLEKVKNNDAELMLDLYNDLVAIVSRYREISLPERRAELDVNTKTVVDGVIYIRDSPKAEYLELSVNFDGVRYKLPNGQESRVISNFASYDFQCEDEFIFCRSFAEKWSFTNPLELLTNDEQLMEFYRDVEKVVNVTNSLYSENDKI